MTTIRPLKSERKVKQTQMIIFFLFFTGRLLETIILSYWGGQSNNNETLGLLQLTLASCSQQLNFVYVASSGEDYNQCPKCDVEKSPSEHFSF